MSDRTNSPPSEKGVRQRAPQRLHSIGQTAKEIVKFLVPRRVLQEIRQYRKFKRSERPLYLKIRVLDGLGLRKRKVPDNLAEARSILFVCFGNIMRSAMCEALMTQELTNHPEIKVIVISAGLNATPGREAHPWGIAAAPQFGVTLKDHRARLLTAEMVDEADVIFAMDYQNEVALFTRYPRAREKVFMLSAFAGPTYSSVEIRDPYYSDEEGTRRCYDVLQTCVQNVVAALDSQMSNSRAETAVTDDSSSASSALLSPRLSPHTSQSLSQPPSPDRQSRNEVPQGRE